MAKLTVLGAANDPLNWRGRRREERVERYRVW